MFLMDGLLDRIRIIFDIVNMSGAEFANTTGYSKKAINTFMDNTIPPVEFLFALVEYLHVKPDFIFLGLEPVFMTSAEVEKLSQK
jgi:hypothetical protein